jgi:uncharacterized protein YbbC (DUF1343 family)
MKPILAAILISTAACAPAPGVLTGIDVLESEGFQELRGKRIGLVTDHTGVDNKGRSTAAILASAPDVSLVAIFSPDYGIAGDGQSVGVSSSSTARIAGFDIPVYSLSSGGIAGMRPKHGNLAGLHALVFDMQDIGSRFYTSLAIMGMALEESARADIGFYVLDRPNPINGVSIEGPTLDDLSLRRISPRAFYAVPVRHGMTAGEVALLYNAEVRNSELHVIAMKGWSRSMWFDQTSLPWVPPSPDMPSLDAATLYPGIALFEASNAAVGLGTPAPYRWIGAPWMNAQAVLKNMEGKPLAGLQISAQDYAPTEGVYAGLLCHGLRLKITDREKLSPLAVFLQIMLALRHVHPNEFVWRWDEAKLMTGNDNFRHLYERDARLDKFQELFEKDARDFEEARKPFLLYPEPDAALLPDNRNDPPPGEHAP